MTVRYSYVDWLQIFRILAAFCFGVAFGVILVHYVHAQDVDCSLNKISCSNPTHDELVQSAQQWNAANCSVRDICTPDCTNFCIITDNQNQMTVCFDDLNSYFKYKMEHTNDTDYKIVYPCPPFKHPNQEDESNK